MILIVDDFQDGAEAICRLLSRCVAECKWAGSGHEALALIRAHPPEQPLLVMLDSMMPGMDGVEVLKAIRSDPRISNTTVLMYSAGFDIAKREEALALGAAAWVLKGGDGASGIQGVISTILHWYSIVGGVVTTQNA